jgi:hypothetical protein
VNLADAEALRQADIEAAKLARVEHLRRLCGFYHPNRSPEEQRRIFRADATLCKRDFFYWCDHYGWVRGEKLEGEAVKDVPFILWDTIAAGPGPDPITQRDLARWFLTRIAAGGYAMVKKSREIGVTWLLLHIYYWLWKFRAQSIRLGSRKEDLVDVIGDLDSLFGKVRYIHNRQPAHLRDVRVIDKHLLIHCLRNNAKIIGESTNEDFGRGGRSYATLIDEFGAVPAAVASDSLSAVESVSHSLALVWTPSGTRHPAFTLFQEAPAERAILMSWRTDPYRPANFKQLQLDEGLSEARFEREYNCSDTAALPGNLIWNFQEDVLVYDEADPRWAPIAAQVRGAHVVVGSWDFGSGASLLVDLFSLLELPAADQAAKLPRIWLDSELWWKSESWRVAASDVAQHVARLGYKGRAIHFGDPAGTHREGDQESWESHLRGAGVPLFCLPDWYNTSEGREWCIKEVQRFIDMDLLRVHRNCRLVLDCLREWKRDVDDFVKLEIVEKEYVRPRHDVHSHPGMALCYLIGGALAYYQSLMGGIERPEPKGQRPGWRPPNKVQGQFGEILRRARM